MLAAVHMQQEHAFEETRHDEVLPTHNDAASASARDATAKVASSDSDILREIARALKPPPMRTSGTPGANGTVTQDANGTVTPVVSEEDALIAMAMSKIKEQWRVASATARQAEAMHGNLLVAAKELEAATGLATAIRAQTAAKHRVAQIAPCVGCVKTEKILAPLSEIIAELDGSKYQQQPLAVGITPLPEQVLAQAGPHGPAEAAAAAVAAARAGVTPQAPCPLASVAAAPIAASLLEEENEIMTEPSRRGSSDEEWHLVSDTDDEADEEQGTDFGPDAEELEDDDEDVEDEEVGEEDDLGEIDDLRESYDFDHKGIDMEAEEDLSGSSFAEASFEEDEADPNEEEEADVDEVDEEDAEDEEESESQEEEADEDTEEEEADEDVADEVDEQFENHGVDEIEYEIA
eukprot:TRINITY_DN775_c0_g2_i2.p1 TRINITY_DN775_c0_g2~~TRINITY_DN775_c0_g2_i2.p1  ORF type:complete len:434 (+),score=140.72 TRINITY_DN775_c0_g2_i2:82-1302(+)